MQREIIKTEDGSDTILVRDLNEPYHSIHGAIRESRHVFVQAGFDYMQKEKVKILEIGLGTGLNLLLTAIRSVEKGIITTYHAIEKYPMEELLLNKLNYSELCGPGAKRIFNRLHSHDWNRTFQLNEFTSVKKIEADLITCSLVEKYHLVYFDAFAPNIQPELWEESVFDKLAGAMYDKGILVTYSSKGLIRRRLQSAGFDVEKLPGPPGKREIIRAVLR